MNEDHLYSVMVYAGTVGKEELMSSAKQAAVDNSAAGIAAAAAATTTTTEIPGAKKKKKPEGFPQDRMGDKQKQQLQHQYQRDAEI